MIETGNEDEKMQARAHIKPKGRRNLDDAKAAWDEAQKDGQIGKDETRQTFTKRRWDVTTNQQTVTSRRAGQCGATVMSARQGGRYERQFEVEKDDAMCQRRGSINRKRKPQDEDKMSMVEENICR